MDYDEVTVVCSFLLSGGGGHQRESGKIDIG